MTPLDAALLFGTTVLVILALPFVVFVCVKVGTFAYFKGKYQFDQYLRSKEKGDGRKEVSGEA